jgi:hypothetical protein
MLAQEMKSRRIVVGAIGDTKDPTTGLLTTGVISSAFIPLVGVQRLQLRWTHEVAVRSGLTANFLQPWYNKPVEISITGESYMGAFSNTGIGAVPTESLSPLKTNAEQAERKRQDSLQAFYNSRIPSYQTKFTTSKVATTNRTVPQVIANIGQQITNTTQKTFDTIQKFWDSFAPSSDNGASPHVDSALGALKTLVSYFNYGPLSNEARNIYNVRHVLIIENEVGQGGDKIPYSVFYGYIRNLEYTESVETPFVYEYNFDFIGIPQLAADLATVIAAVGRETDTFTVTRTNKGFLLREGLGI